MTDKLNSIMPKLVPLLKMMLGGGAPGEIVNAAEIARQKLKAVGSDIHALVARIENPSAAPAAANHDEVMRAYERGRLQGRHEATREAAGVNGFEGHSWSEIAKFCAANSHRLENDFERKFCPSVAQWSRHSSLSEKQKNILRKIFVERFDGTM